MTIDSKQTMRPVWDAILAVYEEFAALCRRNNLRFWVGEGNAIGALRHKGFIPWDDDFDVLMPRPDYERFKRICGKELPRHLKFIDWKNTPECQYLFGKVQDCREDVVHRVESAIGRILADGIYIDILVIDAFPRGCLRKFWYNVKRVIYYCIRRRYNSDLGEWAIKGKALWIIGFLFSIALGIKTRDEAYDRMEKMLCSVSFDGADMTWREGALRRTTNMKIPAKVWEDSVYVPFDKIQVPLPIGFDEYLKMQYGDYMKMPPEEKRVSTHERSSYSPWWLGPTRGGKK